ncbi:MAG: hypothetical protein JWO45_116 [Spartobacteria bacterium]|nr:hypothetical protein [Spartobacteria bacterium]
MKAPPVDPTLEVQLIDPLHGPNWNDFIVSHPDSNFFHSSAWAKVICQTYGHKPVYARFSQKGESVALVPLIEIISPLTGRRGVCLPFSDACGPLVFSENRLSLVTDGLSRIARERKWKYFEIRGGRALEAVAKTAASFYGHRLDLRAGSERLFEGFRSSTKSAIRQALKSDLNVQLERTGDAMLDFYQLHLRTRRRHGVPPQPVSFFLNIHENVIKAGHGFIVSARAGLHAVAAAVFFVFGGQALYKFAASDPKFQRARGNNLVIWEAIRHLIDRGADMLDFGRTSLDNAGLRRFKLSWGSDEEMIRYHRFDVAMNAWGPERSNRAGMFYTRIFRSLPLGVNKMAGTMIYPHLD